MNDVRSARVWRRFGLAAGVVCGAVAMGAVVRAAEATPSAPRLGPDPAQFQQTVARGLDYLVKSQAADGSWSSQAGVGLTALVTTAMLRNGRGPSDPTVAKALRLLEGSVQPDGGIYTPKLDYHNYETCLAVLCFTEANKGKRYDKIIKAADGYIRATQWGPAQGKDRSDLFYGGAGYGKHKRPDLSNTSFLVDALVAAGAGPNDEALQRALVFVSRNQNLESENNTTEFPSKNPDNGFYYTCAGGGDSPAGKTANGGLRSYAAMTYAGLKSMLYAGVGPDDPRVKAATQWAQQHYDLKTNPGLGGDGLYYYYHVFAKALAAAGTDRFDDARGVKHDWRRELAEELAARQRPNGSWANPESRWLEGDPNLVTGYALLALSYCAK
ncbi:MAG: prenyltransferase/squalene oxidase repeat-containing protein [Thermoguttaceae bacterium]|jgi:squalene-hopene/tetraprenyl-beta-curcumene cyclase